METNSRPQRSKPLKKGEKIIFQDGNAHIVMKPIKQPKKTADALAKVKK